jgi:hypothetical protein
LPYIEGGCNWCQILANFICLYTLEESFFLFDEHVKYYFAHLNNSVSLTPCLKEKFFIHTWFQDRMYAKSPIEVHGTIKKLKFCWPV